MKKYDVFLFDADGTLFDFDKAEIEAFKSTFKAFDFEYSDVILGIYKKVNAAAWEAFEKGERSKEEIVIWRFDELFRNLGVECCSKYFNEMYLKELGKGAFLIDGAVEVCREIVACGKQIFIITNGVFSVQESRRKSSLINPYITDTFVSEAVGFQKPDIRYFDHVFANIAPVEKEQILVIGDSLSADIAGGNLAGVDTCWFNPLGIKNTSDIRSTYEVCLLEELQKFI